MKHGFWVAIMAAMLLLACVGGEAPSRYQDRPERAVQAVAGDPSHIDVECDSTRWANGMCDLVIYMPAVTVTPTDSFVPGQVLSASLLNGGSPRIWEHGAPTTIRIWLIEVWNTYQDGCAVYNTGDQCTVLMWYTSSSSQMYLHVTGRIGSGGRPLVSAYMPSGSEALLLATYAVAYDTVTGSYGVTGRARRTARHTDTGLAVMHDLPNPVGNRFADDSPNWYPLD